MTLLTHHLAFTARATTPLELDAQAGSSLRGALVGALWGRFCANKAAPSCAACPLVAACPVAALIAPLREDPSEGGDQRLFGSSSHLHARIPIGGLVGQITFAGDLGELREPLFWGSLVHIGKNAVKGDGWVEIRG